ncbi:MAG: restriction endonuclease [Clostridia bacterium]|nr:restriction endonuclease [Clostridia bacterium]
MEILRIILPSLFVLLIIAWIAYFIYRRSGVTIGKLDKMDGVEFENAIADLYRTLGYTVQTTKASGDQGIDIIIKKTFHGTKGLQLKRYDNPVGNSAVQEAVAGKKFYGLDKVAVLTNNYFTKSARELARANKVELIGREEVKRLIEKAKRAAKKKRKKRK